MEINPVSMSFRNYQLMMTPYTSSTLENDENEIYFFLRRVRRTTVVQATICILEGLNPLTVCTPTA